MRIILMFLLLGICGIITADISKDDGKIKVLKFGDKVFVRSYFSPNQDVVIRLAKGRNGQINFASAALVDNAALMNLKNSYGGILIHGCGDDSTPWKLNGTYIGANHGCYAVLELTANSHELRETALGSEWVDAKGSKFYLIKILDPDRIWLLSENLGKNGVWKFNRNISGRVLKNMAGRTLKFTARKRNQLTPSLRIKKQAYLVDGKTPLPDGKVVICDFLDIVDNYDIIAPDSLLEKIRKNPGRKVNFTGNDLESVVTNEILYRFQSRGTCIIQHNSKANRDFTLQYMGFIQTAPLTKGKFDTLEYLIPKTVPFEQKGVKYDFSGFQDFSEKLSQALFFNKNTKNLASLENLPDRWIQFLGEKENGKIRRKAGYVIGYSLIDGITRSDTRAKNVSRAGFIYTSNKSYPTAIDQTVNPVKKGQHFKCIAYRQYFDPLWLSKKAANSYMHKQGDDWILYIDYLRPVKQDVIRLPGNLTGKEISVVEKTTGIKLLSGTCIPESGIKVLSENKYGYLVLKINSSERY